MRHHLRAEPSQLLLHRRTVLHLDQRTPAGELLRDVQRIPGADPHPHPAVSNGSLHRALPTELVSEHAQKPFLQRQRRGDSRSPLLDLADHPLPSSGEVEPRRAMRGHIGHLSSTDTIHPEAALPGLRAGDQVPEVVLVDQTQWVHHALRPLTGCAAPPSPTATALRRDPPGETRPEFRAPSAH